MIEDESRSLHSTYKLLVRLVLASMPVVVSFGKLKFTSACAQINNVVTRRTVEFYAYYDSY